MELVTQNSSLRSTRRRFYLVSLREIMEPLNPMELVHLGNLFEGGDILRLQREWDKLYTRTGRDRNKELSEDDKQFLEEFRAWLKRARDFTEKTGLVKMSAMFERALARFDEAVIDLPAIGDDLIYIEKNLAFELESKLFFWVPTEKSEYYTQPQPLFGQKVESEFSSASWDIAAAGRCYALDEWTACVFHLMRVLELGLGTLAGQLNIVPKTEDQWQNIIDSIESEVERLRSLSRTQRPDSTVLKFYSEACTDFRHFKAAWRNHVAHARERSDERDATRIWNHVQSFMQHLADGIS
jgi:hypothetical protein